MPALARIAEFFLNTARKTHFYWLIVKGILNFILIFLWFFIFLVLLFCLQFGASWWFLLNISVFSVFFQSKIALELKKHKNVFFMFPGIKIRGRLTKNNDFFRISCHLLPANERFSKSGLHLFALLSGRENHQKTQNFHFFDFWCFWIFWTKSGC